MTSTADGAVTESTRLRTVIGKDAAKLAKERDVHTVGDFLEFLPRRYLDPARTTDFSTLAKGEYTVVVATVARAVTRPMRQRRGRMLIVTVVDDTGHQMDLTFFKPYGHEGRLRAGERGVFSGVVGRYRDRWQLTHPAYDLFGEGDDPSSYGDGLIPIYLQVKGVTSMMLTKVAQLVFHALEELADPVPAAVRMRRALAARLESYRLLHLPEHERDLRRATRRLRYQEAFVVQTSLAQRRLSARAQAALPRVPVPGGLLEAFEQRLPFELTEGQRRVGEQIAGELALDRPMHRLLQGEVGSGKTVVALRAMLGVIDSGGQAVLLAPTEVLAAQHHRSITQMLGPLAEAGMLGGSAVATRVALLTGSGPAATRRTALLQAASGEAGIVVGTHALIQEHVSFADLGLVVVDEQHRFGVEQRDALRSKAEHPPHVLVMTATPIPRTVAMTVYGDMETSVLTELPRGRSEIASHIVPTERPDWVQRTWERVAEEARAGHQAYVVCPRIGAPDEPGDETAAQAGAPHRHLRLVGEDEGFVEVPTDEDADRAPPPLRSVYRTEQELRADPALGGLRIEILHGRMSGEDKDAVMRSFAEGRIDVLVSTTVIEVGVDVPNATVMVVMDADRFGISQIHQLRGRVGRGSAPGLCLLMTDAPEDGASRARLRSVASTTDGFALARLDLEQRREGDVLGASQSGGRSQLRHLRLLRDEELILQAREDAWEVVEQDPSLRSHPVLRTWVAALDDEQAAFLERG